MLRSPSLAALLVVVVALTVTIPGCGFHLRGQSPLPAELRRVYLGGPADLTDALAVYVDSAGAQRTATRDDADAMVDIARADFRRRVLSVDPDTGKEREFELIYVVGFGVRGSGGTVLVAPQSFSLRRDYVFDPNVVIGKGQEEEVLRDEMRRDAAQQILRRLERALAP